MIMEVASESLLIPEDEIAGARHPRKSSNHDRAEGKQYDSL
jgi:hypothetical protein